MGDLKMKYMVIIKKWSDEYHDQIEVVAATFDSFFNASLFRDAYNKHYSASAYIIERV